MKVALEKPEPGVILPLVDLSEMEQLSNAKQCALIELARGSSISKAARRIGRSRATIYNWLRDDAQFAAAFNAWKNEQGLSTRARLTVLCDKAVDRLEESLSDPDGKMAMKLLVGMGMIAPQQTECEDAEEIALKRELDRRQRKAQLRKAIKALDLEEAAASPPPIADQQPFSKPELRPISEGVEANPEAEKQEPAAFLEPCRSPEPLKCKKVSKSAQFGRSAISGHSRERSASTIPNRCNASNATACPPASA